MLRSTIFNAGANLFKAKNAQEIPLFEDVVKKDNVNIEQKQNERDLLFG